ncbi:MAG: type IV pilus modification PilV family protein [Planctomycetota bacterium]
MHRRQSGIGNTMNERGFSLLEVVVALGIFSIGILAIAGLQITATSGNATARFGTEAATLAQDVVERLLSIDYVRDSVPLRSEFNSAANGTRAYQDPSGRYTIDWTVSGPDTPIDRAITINVTVRWWAYGIPRRYNLNFIKTEEI